MTMGYLHGMTTDENNRTLHCLITEVVLEFNSTSIDHGLINHV